MPASLLLQRSARQHNTPPTGLGPHVRLDPTCARSPHSTAHPGRVAHGPAPTVLARASPSSPLSLGASSAQLPLALSPTTASANRPAPPSLPASPIPRTARSRRLPLPLARPTGQSGAGTTSVPPARGLHSRPGPQVGATHPRFPFLAQALTDWPTPQLRPLPSFPPPRNSRAREDRRDHRDLLPAAPHRKPHPTPLKPTVTPLRT